MSTKGFTLLEMAITIVALSFVLMSTIELVSTKMKSNEYQEIKQAAKDLRKQIIGYAILTNHLPPRELNGIIPNPHNIKYDPNLIAINQDIFKDILSIIKEGEKADEKREIKKKFFNEKWCIDTYDREEYSEDCSIHPRTLEECEECLKLDDCYKYTQPDSRYLCNTKNVYALFILTHPDYTGEIKNSDEIAYPEIKEWVGVEELRSYAVKGWMY
ncbi:type II secretion system protein [Candidatus Albibeggiatoa sp. nov. NOAA]|uniref:type II secretion system protein n=1 Tax=Candidatus Albibeggiatoa sp. nov. NOAA TaxID=3162724 RepID=UPI0032FFA039|nr:type II secretion system GspH family protein [Thiotrichaceae bacterium]